jgi:hypothetical protein
MADRWAYVGHTDWVLGENIPALTKGGPRGGQTLNAAGWQFFGNCVTNAGKLPDELRRLVFASLTGSKPVAHVDPVTFVSSVGGVSRKTARSWFHALNERGWASAFTCKDAHGTTPGTTVAVEPNGASRLLEAAVGTPDALAELPAVLPSVVVDTESDDEGLDSYLNSGPRELKPCSHVAKWRQHENYAVGMRLAELATMWLVHGWQKDAFSKFTWWLSQQAPNIIGNLHHTKR